MAHLLWPGQSPIGQQLRYGVGASANNPPHTVIGVVGNVKARATDDENAFDIYRPLSQASAQSTIVVVRGKGDARALAAELSKAVWRVDREASTTNIQPMESVIGQSIWQRRLTGVIVGVFSVVWLLLAAVGIYGVMSYSVKSADTGGRDPDGDGCPIARLAGMPLVLISVSVLACYLPARRAARWDPVVALAHE
jgi:ABC-type antimicrobial peptide transport system permease subunit